MTDTGVDLLQAIQQLRGYFEDVSKLLLTADALMEVKGWEWLVKEDKVLGGTSVTGKLSRQWMPYEVHRFYISATYPKVVCGVSVLLDQRKAGAVKLNEPLVCGIATRYGPNEAVGKPDWTVASVHLSMPNYSPENSNDGQILESTRDELVNVRRVGVRTCTFAHPLVRIVERAALEDLVVTPLVDSARKLVGIEGNNALFEDLLSDDEIVSAKLSLDTAKHVVADGISPEVAELLYGVKPGTLSKPE